MKQQNLSTRGLLVVALLAIGLTSCAGKRAAKAETAEAAKNGQPVDMTRPPRTIGVEREVVVESDPNETISFEEWKRRQDAAASGETGDSDE